MAMEAVTLVSNQFMADMDMVLLCMADMDMALLCMEEDIMTITNRHFRKLH